jgi:hypothetical protein
MASLKDLRLNANQLKYIFNHVFLPPNVPQEDDYRDSDEKALLRVIEHALEQFKSHITHELRLVIENICGMIHRLGVLLDRDGITNGERLQDALANLANEGRNYRSD